jgi:GNAT superfamily N-acetyltransferase
MIIRRATEGDAPALCAILHDTFVSTWLPKLTPAAVQRHRDEDRPTAYIRERSAEFRVAECDGQVVGFVDWNADFINALHVHSRHALRGFGSRLMDLAEQEIASAGYPQARLETDTFNSRARAFYAKRGYREAEQYPDIEWNSGLTTLLLVKALR